MDFAMLPPEVNSGRMYSGAGPGPMLAAATAWDRLSTELHMAATGYESTMSEVAIGWSGPSATAMTAAATRYVTWLHAAALQADQTAIQAKVAAAAYETAFAMTVPPPVIAANRSQLITLVATNFLGQNTAAIAATEAHYAEMWAQDAVAMYNYAGSAAAASVLNPFAPPPNTTNPVATAGQAVITSAASHASTAGAQLSAVPSALHSLSAPAAALGSTADPTLLGAFTSSLGTDPALASSYLGLAITLFGSIVVDSVGTFGIDAIGTFVIDVGGVAIGAMEAGSLPIVGLMSWSSPVAAGCGQAAAIGGLSVPSAWATAVPSAIQHVATTLAASTAETGPTFAGLPFAQMASAGMAGGATSAAGQSGRGGTGTTKLKRSPAPKAPPNTGPKAAPKGPITGISAKLRRLAALRDVGILTQEKFTEKKQRLLAQQS